jgi:hypothetical protein
MNLNLHDIVLAFSVSLFQTRTFCHNGCQQRALSMSAKGHAYAVLTLAVIVSCRLVEL